MKTKNDFLSMADFIPEEENLEKLEGRIQAECFEWFHNTFPLLRGLLYHVPNGGYRNKIEAVQLQAMGVVAGVPDLEFHFYRRTYFIEMKTPTGTVSKDQKKIHNKLDEHGFQTWIVRSLEDFKNVIYSIINDKTANFERGLTKEQFVYRNNVFMYLYGLEEGQVVKVDDLTENPDKLRSVVFEFMNEGFDALEGFEILFTSDYSCFYKKSRKSETNIVIDGYNSIEIPAKNEG